MNVFFALKGSKLLSLFTHNTNQHYKLVWFTKILGLKINAIFILSKKSCEMVSTPEYRNGKKVCEIKYNFIIC